MVKGLVRAIPLGVSLIVLVLLFAACTGRSDRPPVAAVPPNPPVLPERSEEIIVADFAETAPVADLALGPKIADYLASEMRAAFKGKISRRAGLPSSAAAALDHEAWKSAGGGVSSAVFLFGLAGLTEQAQKALKEGDMPKDGPFRLEGRGLAERKRFILTIECFLIDAASGAVIWQHQIKETRIYDGVSTVADYALTDLLPAVRARLFPLLFGAAPAAR
jgi:hypothetical protein